MNRRPLVLVLLSVILGILLASHQPHNLAIVITLSAGISLLLLSTFLLNSLSMEALAVVMIFTASGALISTPSSPDPLLQNILSRNRRVKFQGTVLDPGIIQQGVSRFNILVQNVYVDGEAKKVHWKARITVYNNPPTLLPGQSILLSAVPRKFRNFQNPGSFNYERDMHCKGFAFSAPISDGRRVVPLGKGKLPFPDNLIERMRRPIRDLLSSTLEGQELAIYSAIVLGERNLLSPQLKEKFARTGLSHVLAISGLHIGLVAWIAFFVIRRILLFSYTLSLRLDVRKVAALCTCLPILAYVTVSGFQVSATRAMIMAFAFLWSLILGREKEIWSTLCLSALVILFIQPHALYQISFQLSYLAVAGLIWLCPPVLRKISALADKYLSAYPLIVKASCLYLWSLGVITLTATLFLLPVTVYYFHRISLVSFLTNFLVIPVLGLLAIPAGLISAIIYPLWPHFARFVLLVGAGGVDTILWVVRVFDMLPLCSVWSITPSVMEIAIFYAGSFCIFFWRRNRWFKVGLAVICVLAIVDVGYWVSQVRFNRELRISFLDVGQGNSALVEFPGGKKMLIDGGGFYRDTFDVGKMVVAPFLWSQKISRIDYLVLTHPESDHMNGLKFIAKNFAPKVFYFNGQQTHNKSFKQLMQILKEKRVQIVVAQHRHEKLVINEVRVDFINLGPEDFSNPALATSNNRSLVILINLGSKRIMFPGDIEEEAERILVETEGSHLKSQILLAPHHGSKTSCSRPFLDAVRPKVCIISCRGSTRLKLPDKVVLERLAKVGCLVLRTDIDGMVRIAIMGHRIRIGSFKSHFRTISASISAQDPGKY